MGESPTPPKKQINFLRGWPHPSLLPTSQILAASQTALSDPKISIPGLCYGPDPGYQPLREEISKWLSAFYTPPSSKESQTTQLESESKADGADRICITGGASQNLACVLQVFTDPLVTRVWMVAPCYFLACRIFEDAGLRCRGVGEGEEGIDLERLERGLQEREGEMVEPLKKPKPWSKIYKHIIYCVPTFSNPSGKTMSLSQRQNLVQLARKYDALIITDDVYDFLQWPTSSPSTERNSSKHALLPRLVDVDRTLDPVPSETSFGNAMSNGSFSKIAGPGARTGWAEATPKFTYGLSQCGSSRSGGAPSQLVATMMAELLKSGELQKHISHTLCLTYKKRFELMISAIEEHLIPLGVKLGEVEFKDGNNDGVFGGYFIWINLPEDMDAEVVTQRAKEAENLIVAPGHIFEVQGDSSLKFENQVRLCFAWEDEEDLVEGVKRLGKVMKGLKGRDGMKSFGRDTLKQDLGEFS